MTAIRRFPLFRRMAAGFLAAIVGFANALLPHAAEANFWEERRSASRRAGGTPPSGASDSLKLLASLPEARQAVVNPALAPIASGGLGASGDGAADAAAFPDVNGSARSLLPLILPHGSVREARFSRDPAAPLVVHVQDAHGVPEAQRNIAAIIEKLSSQTRFPSPWKGEGGGGNSSVLVGVEGASGPSDLDAFRAWPDRAITRDIAALFLGKGSITGAEFAGLSAEIAPTLWGVEDLGLYKDNIQAFLDARSLKGEMDRALEALSGRAAASKARDYSENLRVFDQRVAAYHSRALDLAGYVGYLGSVPGPWTAGRFPNVRLLRQALEQEKALDFKEVERERQRLIRRLADALDRSSLEGLVKRSLDLRAGRFTYGAYHAHLKELCRRAGIDGAFRGPLGAYSDYVGLAERIDRNALLDELPALERAAGESLARTEDERRLLAAGRRLALLQKLSSQAMTPQEWAAYEAERLEVLRLPEALGAEAPGWSAGLLAPFESFCRSAVLRNGALVENLVRKISEDKKAAPLAVLVAGGFHTEGLTRLMRDKDLSYLVVTPRITQVPKEGNYLDVFVRETLPLEKLFAGETVHMLYPPAGMRSTVDGSLDPSFAERALGEFRYPALALGELFQTDAIVVRVQGKGGRSFRELRPHKPGSDFQGEFEIETSLTALLAERWASLRDQGRPRETAPLPSTRKPSSRGPLSPARSIGSLPLEMLLAAAPRQGAPLEFSERSHRAYERRLWVVVAFAAAVAAFLWFLPTLEVSSLLIRALALASAGGSVAAAVAAGVAWGDRAALAPLLEAKTDRGVSGSTSWTDAEGNALDLRAFLERLPAAKRRALRRVIDEERSHQRGFGEFVAKTLALAGSLTGLLGLRSPSSVEELLKEMEALSRPASLSTDASPQGIWKALFVGGTLGGALLATAAWISQLAGTSLGMQSILAVSLFIIHQSLAEKFLLRAMELLVTPRLLPGVEHEGGLPGGSRTVAYYPILFHSIGEVEAFGATLRASIANNDDPNIKWVFLSTSSGEVKEAEERLARELQAVYGEARIFYLHRDPAMGNWEKKRGGYMQFLLWLRAGFDRSGFLPKNERFPSVPEGRAFDQVLGDLKGLDGVRHFAIGDSDTRWAPGSIAKLAGKIEHPANARYAIFQGSLTVENATESLMTRVAHHMSSVKLDESALLWTVLGQFHFLGHGAGWDIDRFLGHVAGRMKPGYLSHDIVESVYAPTAYVPDVKSGEDVPSIFALLMQQLGRWWRGNLMTFGFFGRRVANESGALERNPASFVNKYLLYQSSRPYIETLAGLVLLVLMPLSGLEQSVFSIAFFALLIIDGIVDPLVRSHRKGALRFGAVAVLLNILVSLGQMVEISGMVAKRIVLHFFPRDAAWRPQSGLSKDWSLRTASALTVFSILIGLGILAVGAVHSGYLIVPPVTLLLSAPFVQWTLGEDKPFSVFSALGERWALGRSRPPSVPKGLEFNTLKYAAASAAPAMVVGVTMALARGVSPEVAALLAIFWGALLIVSFRYGQITWRAFKAWRASRGLPALDLEDRVQVRVEVGRLMKQAFFSLGAAPREVQVSIPEEGRWWVPARRIKGTQVLEVSPWLAKLIRHDKVAQNILRLIMDQEARRFLDQSTLRIFLSRLQFRPFTNPLRWTFRRLLRAARFAFRLAHKMGRLVLRAPPRREAGLTVVEIAHVDLADRGGIESYLRELHARLLQSPGMRIHCVYVSTGKTGTFEEKIGDGVLVHHVLPLQRGRTAALSPRRFAAFYREVQGIIRSEPVDLLHVHTPHHPASHTAAWWLGLRYGIPRVVTTHFARAWTLKPRALAANLSALLLTFGTAYLFGVSRASAKALLQRPAMLASGVDVDFFTYQPELALAFRERWDVPDDTQIIFYPARFDPLKGQKDLLDLARRIKAEGFEARIYLMGAESSRAYARAVREEIAAAGLTDVVHTLPAGSRDLVREGLAAADVVVFPSYSEALGLTALEASAMKVPVVAYASGGLPEAVRDGRTGYLVPTGNKGALADKVVTLLRSKTLRDKLGEGGRAFVQGRFSLDRLAERHLRLYERIRPFPAGGIAVPEAPARDSSPTLTTEKIRRAAIRWLQKKGWRVTETRIAFYAGVMEVQEFLLHPIRFAKDHPTLFQRILIAILWVASWSAPIVVGGFLIPQGAAIPGGVITIVAAILAAAPLVNIVLHIPVNLAILVAKDISRWLSPGWNDLRDLPRIWAAMDDPDLGTKLTAFQTEQGAQEAGEPPIPTRTAQRRLNVVVIMAEHMVKAYARQGMKVALGDALEELAFSGRYSQVVTGPAEFLLERIAPRTLTRTGGSEDGLPNDQAERIAAGVIAVHNDILRGEDRQALAALSDKLLRSRPDLSPEEVGARLARAVEVRKARGRSGILNEFGRMVGRESLWPSVATAADATALREDLLALARVFSRFRDLRGTAPFSPEALAEGDPKLIGRLIGVKGPRLQRVAEACAAISRGEAGAEGLPVSWADMADDSVRAAYPLADDTDVGMVLWKQRWVPDAGPGEPERLPSDWTPRQVQTYEALGRVYEEALRDIFDGRRPRHSVEGLSKPRGWWLALSLEGSSDEDRIALATRVAEGFRKFWTASKELGALHSRPIHRLEAALDLAAILALGPGMEDSVEQAAARHALAVLQAAMSVVLDEIDLPQPGDAAYWSERLGMPLEAAEKAAAIYREALELFSHVDDPALKKERVVLYLDLGERVLDREARQKWDGTPRSSWFSFGWVRKLLGGGPTLTTPVTRRAAIRWLQKKGWRVTEVRIVLYAGVMEVQDFLFHPIRFAGDHPTAFQQVLIGILWVLSWSAPFLIGAALIPHVAAIPGGAFTVVAAILAAAPLANIFLLHIPASLAILEWLSRARQRYPSAFESSEVEALEAALQEPDFGKELSAFLEEEGLSVPPNEALALARYVLTKTEKGAGLLEGGMGLRATLLGLVSGGAFGERATLTAEFLLERIAPPTLTRTPRKGSGARKPRAERPKPVRPANLKDFERFIGERAASSRYFSDQDGFLIADPSTQVGEAQTFLFGQTNTDSWDAFSAQRASAQVFLSRFLRSRGVIGEVRRSIEASHKAIDDLFESLVDDELMDEADEAEPALTETPEEQVPEAGPTEPTAEMLEALGVVDDGDDEQFIGQLARMLFKTRAKRRATQVIHIEVADRALVALKKAAEATPAHPLAQKMDGPWPFAELTDLPAI